MQSFNIANLLPKIKANITAMGFKELTFIQQKIIPQVLEGHDLLISAQTGSGKTAAFLIPIVTQLLTKESFKSIVLLPTRELATQVLKEKAESYSTNPVPNGRQAYIVLGPPASGKSFFAEEIAKNYDLAIADNDDAKAIIPELEAPL